jgi:antitoxin (DNA-binding transcriptional repressor) of toxin-antitoxin stability system
VIGDRWGVDADEVARRYPCDDLVPRPVLSAWRGVTVDASPDRVWPWLVQIRLAPYSYDRVDNLGHRSPQRLCGLPDPAVGDPFTAVGGRPVGRIVSVEPGHHLTGRIMGAVMSYVLVPSGPRTRLLLKVVLRRGRPVAPLVSVGDLVMARRQLLNLKQLAEG